MQQAIKRILNHYHLKGPNFDDTPARVERMFDTFFHIEEPKLSIFPSSSNEMIMIKDHISWGFCPHHLLPVKYTFRIGYIPNGLVLGLSKLPRVADYCVSFMPLQEDLPVMITDILLEKLKPQGIGVNVEGEHLCMRMRGVKSSCVSAVTTKLTGIILLNPSTHYEFFR